MGCLHVGSSSGKGPSPLNLKVLTALLSHYPNTRDSEYLWSGFYKGSRIPAIGERQVYSAGNLKSVRGMEHIVRDKIAKEIKEGRVLGPFVSPPLVNL